MTLLHTCPFCTNQDEFSLSQRALDMYLSHLNKSTQIKFQSKCSCCKSFSVINLDQELDTQ